MTTTTPTQISLTRKDFVSDQTVRWCPGCGDYSILAQMQRVLPDIGVPKENIVFISGIGCSSRFPYYMNTYGIHTIHGRAPTIATGLVLANPDLSVWVVTGDGDGLSIGGNHLLHAVRRNVNLNILLFNNRIYGLTKGQYSPTSRTGKVTKSSPMGSIEQPMNPVAVALAAQATFVRRTLDSHPQHLAETLRRAPNLPAHRLSKSIKTASSSTQRNGKVWTTGARGDNNILYLEHGMPMVFGKDSDKGIRLSGFRPEVVDLADVDEQEVVVHDASSMQLALLLSSMEYPEYPAPLGIIRDVRMPHYGEQLLGQVQRARKSRVPVTSIRSSDRPICGPSPSRRT